MSPLQLRAFLNLWMCSDPWPCTDSEHERLESWLDDECRRHGFDDWVDAYHRLLKGTIHLAGG